MSQEPYETNSDANDMAPSVEPNIELANQVVEEVLLMPRDFIKTSLNIEGTHVNTSDPNVSLVDAALVNPVTAEITDEEPHPDFQFLELPKIPAETLAAIEEQNAKAQLVTEDIPKVVYIPTSAPLADAISTNTQGQPTHIQVGHIHFRNPA